MNIWQSIQTELEEMASTRSHRAHGLLTSFYEENFLHAKSLGHASAILVSNILHIPTSFPRQVIREIIEEVLISPEQEKNIEQDLIAIYERDPACTKWTMTMLANKGFYALCLHRVAHTLIHEGEKELALIFNTLACRNFTIDIHPCAKLANGLFIDHGNSIVIGETAIVDENVSILQDVTLGGTGKETGDRHPKIKEGVLIGAGAKILGNVTIGAYSKVGAGSVVLRDIPPYTTAVGVPARIIENTQSPRSPEEKSIPAKEMEHRFPNGVSPTQETHLP